MSFPAETQGRRGTDKAAMSTSPLRASAPQRDNISKWPVKRLGDVSQFHKIQGIHGGLPYVGLEHIESDTGRFIGSYEPQAAKSSTFRFSQDHILYGRLRPYLNKAFAPDFEGHCSTEIFPIKPSPELSREYLLYWFLADETKDRINATCTGARMPRADMNEVLEFVIPVPPLPEQERIVGILDEAFDGLAKAKATAEASLQNARALFQSHLQTIFSQKGEGWVETTIGATFKTVTGNTPSKSNASYFGDFMPLVKPPELLDDCIGNVADSLSKAGADVARTLPVNSVLVSCIGNLGKIGINSDPVAFNQQINAILPNQRLANPELMFFQALSSGFKQQLEDMATGTTVPIVNKSKFNEIRIVLPPMDKQLAIVENLKSLRAETLRLESLYRNKLNALDELKKSLLHQAFTGNL